MPGNQQQMSRFGAILPVGGAFYGTTSPRTSLTSNESQLVTYPSPQQKGGSASFNPFYIIPLGGGELSSGNPPPLPSTTTEQPITTTTLEPLQQLIGFLYSVGYANESTPPPEHNLDRPLTLFDLAMLTKTSNIPTKNYEQDDQEDDEAGESEEEQLGVGTKSKVEINRSTPIKMVSSELSFLVGPAGFREMTKWRVRAIRIII
ncbi:hypothetical protein Fcan01_08735 [Folsomia candida]|uniref:Uncharacterized protein n=2 Tax=Folsomia candida TaxID=158441 RepID=A0A226EH38_FOLCA|nr:hypothetical protein Fcan01_08735 [Folsomia candida]